jgi:hypothetical protein
MTRTDRDNFYALTGEIIREWVTLEQLLSLWLIDLLGIDEHRSHLLWNSYGDLRSKLNFLKTLISQFATEALQQESRGIFTTTEKIAEDRFILAHTFGTVDAAASQLVYGEKSVSTDSLRSWLQDIKGCQNSIRSFKSKLGHGLRGSH